MRRNDQASLRTSSLHPNDVNLRRQEHPQVVCQVCGCWRKLKRSMIYPHRLDDEITRCPGSGQHITVDEDEADWLLRYQQACVDASKIRAGRVLETPRPPVVPAVCQLANA